MAEHDAVFGGEHSAHYYFREFWGADTGMLAALHVLAVAGRSDDAAVGAGRRLHPLRRVGRDQLDRRRPGAVIDAVAAAFAGRGEARTGSTG